MLRIALPSALYIALFTICAGANPLPPGAVAAIPSNFILAPLYTPPPPPSDGALASSLDTDAHIIRDSYIIVLQDHLEEHNIVAHHEQVESLHKADLRLMALKASSSGSPNTVAVGGDFDGLEGIGHKYHVGKNSGKKGFKGYSGKFSSSTLDAIRTLKEVKYVERDSVVWASEIEKGAPWVSLSLSILHSR